MLSWEKEIQDFNKSLEQGSNLGANSHYLEDRELVKACIADNLEINDTKADFLKGFGADLEKRFKNGSWKTINGSKVFINGGKVVAGLDGFNKEIDKFFDEKKAKQSSSKGGEEKKEVNIPKYMQNDLDDAKRLIQHYTKQGDTKRLETAKDRLKQAEAKIEKYKQQVGGGDITSKGSEKKEDKPKGDSKKETNLNTKEGIQSSVDSSMEKLEPNKTKESKQTLDQKISGLSESDKKLINDNKSFFEKRNNTFDSFLTGKQLVDKHRDSLTKNYAFSVTVNGEKFHAQKVRGQNKYIAFDKDGNRLNEGLKSSKQDFEELVKDGLRVKKRDDVSDKPNRRKNSNLSPKQQNVLESSQASYDKAPMLRQKEMFEQVQGNLDKHKKGETIGFGLDPDMVAAGKQFIADNKADYNKIKKILKDRGVK